MIDSPSCLRGSCIFCGHVTTSTPSSIARVSVLHRGLIPRVAWGSILSVLSTSRPNNCLLALRSRPSCPMPASQNILVVGAGRGIGFEIVKSLLRNKREFLSITAFDKSFSWSVDDDDYAIFDSGSTVSMLHGDVTLAQDRDGLVERCQESGGIDTLVYCAGVITPIERVENLSIEAVKETFDVNVFGAMEMVSNS